MAYILEVENLVKNFADFQAVKGISFTVEEGEIFGLLGPNGAGKTTTISMLTGVLRPTSGTAKINGFDLLKEPLAVKRMIGLVPQDIALYPTINARANLNFFGSIYGLRGHELEQRVDDVLSIVGLSERQKEPVEKYSGGMKRRLNIAAGLVHQPRLLFLDEPTVGVDPQSRNNIFESVLKLNRERGMSIIYTSHYMEEVELLCSRVAIIDQGQIIALDTIKNLVSMLGAGILHIGLGQVDDAIIQEIIALPSVKLAEKMNVTLPEAAVKAESQQEEKGEPNILKIEAENSHKAVIDVIELMNQKDIPITSLEILEPNLESVFLHLTGKKLRE
jgi:ABC-2 type transport system ATP-binding protein